MWSAIILFAICSFRFEIATACNGYKLKLNYVKNCDNDNVVKVGKDFDVTMDKDCNIIIAGCLNFTKTVTSAKGRYTLKKPPLPSISADVDLCETVEKNKVPQITKAISSLGITPTKCPVAAKLACGSPNKKISIAEFKNQIGLAAGKTEISLDVKHNEGKTCVKFSFDMHK